MKRYILILLTAIVSLTASAQKSVTTSEKTKFYVNESDTEYQVKASFPMDRSKRFYDLLKASLGEAKYTKANTSFWENDNYTAVYSAGSFKASLDKDKASAKQLAFFKKLTEELQASLDQPKAPRPPAPPKTY